MGEKTINGIVTGYLNYVTKCPQLLKELLNESRLSEYVAVKEVVVTLPVILSRRIMGWRSEKTWKGILMMLI